MTLSITWSHVHSLLFSSREQEIAFVSQAYAHVEEINFELEQYKMQARNLENLVAKATEEQETLEAQLYETGHALDQANAEVHVHVHACVCQKNPWPL